MRNLIVLALCALAQLLPGATSSTTFSAVSSGPVITVSGSQPFPQTLTYQITGTFVATLVLEYSQTGQNYAPYATFTGTVGPLTIATPGYYYWACTAYTSGSPIGIVTTPYPIYQQQRNNAGTIIFQVDDSGLSFVGSPGGTGSFGSVLVNPGSVVIGTIGGGLSVKEGTNAKQGVATLSSGSVVVSNTSVTAKSRIFLTVQSLGTITAPVAVAVTSITPTTGFTITSADGTDTSVIGWEIIEGAP